MSNYYIVWNADKSEGFATTDKGVAYEARKGAESNCFTEDGVQSKLAQAFCEIWSHGEDCTMVECNERERLLTEALQALLIMDVNGHALQDRLQFTDKGRALLEQARHALGVAL